MSKVSLYLLIVFLSVIAFTACTRSADKLPAQGTATSQAPTQPVPPAMQQATPPPETASPQAGPMSEKVVPIESDFNCRLPVDCTSTKYSNTPTSPEQCQCAADCTPYVVNKTEADRREAANKRFCTTEDWFGDECPDTECGFVEFESFKCMNGKCVGIALGR